MRNNDRFLSNNQHFNDKQMNDNGPRHEGGKGGPGGLPQHHRNDHSH